MKKIFLLLLCSSLALVSCKKENNTDDSSTLPPPPPGQISASIVVQVNTSAGTPVQNAMVIAGPVQMSTNADGLALISGSTFLPGKNTIKIAHPQYYGTVRVVNLQNNARLSVQITAKPKPMPASFNNASGGTINASGGGSIIFSPNTITTMSGGTYTGNVMVSAKYIAPDAVDASDLMPNSFSGSDAGGQTKFLENHGALLVELDGMGQPLKLGSGTATIKIPVAAHDLGSAPATIPLYYFDEQSGSWKEDGQATLNGNEYVGTVTHFTFWMCPFVYNHYSLTGSVTCGANALQGVNAAIYNQWGAYLGTSTTDPTGTFNGMIPDQLTFNLKIYDVCGAQVSSTAIGPFTANTTINPIDVCAAGANCGIIKGYFTDCSGAIDQNAFCRVQAAGVYRMLAPSPSGYINSAVLFCNGTTSALVTGINLAGSQVSADMNLAVSTNMDFDTLQVCNTATEYCQFNLDGSNYYYNENAYANFSGVLDLTANKIILTVTSGQFMNETHFNVSIPATTTGTHTVGGSPFAYSFYVSGNNGTTNLQVTLSYVGTSVGDKIEGTITPVTYNDAGGNPRSLSACSFRVNIDTVQ